VADFKDPIAAAEAIVGVRHNSEEVVRLQTECLIVHDHTEGDCEFPDEENDR
jgi:hypothetical protein